MYKDIHIGSIGIDYRGTPNQLNGCVLDLNHRQVWAEKFAVQRRVCAEKSATFEGITNMVLSLFEGMNEGDLAIITRSGHGTRVPDRNGDEVSGFDSAFVPYDYQRGLYLDDDWAALMGRRKHGTFVLLLDDFCHSGTAARGFQAEHDRQAKPRFVHFHELVSQQNGLCPKIADALMARERPRGGESVPEGVVSITGCKDTEYSYDTSDGGAFTLSSERAWRQLPIGASLADWYAKLVPAYLPKPGRFPQTPQFHGSDVLKAFIAPGLKPPAFPPVFAVSPPAAGPGVEVIVGGYRAKTWERIGS